MVYPYFFIIKIVFNINTILKPVSYTHLNETLENLTGEKVLEVFPYEQGRLEKYTTIVPILGSGQRLGTLVVSRYNDKFTDCLLYTSRCV